MPNFRYLEEDEEVLETEEESLDFEDLSDVEARLEEANCFKALLQNPLFGPDAPEVAASVETKVKNFIRNELGILLGLNTPVPVQKSAFEDDEVKLLKTWAGVLKGRPHLMSGKTSTEPEVKPATVQAAPEIKTAVAKPVTISTNVVKTENKPYKKTTAASTTKKPRAKKNTPATTKKQVEINGVWVDMPENTRQTKPAANTPGYMPPLPPEESAMYKERVALTTAPTGLIGAAAGLAANLGE